MGDKKILLKYKARHITPTLPAILHFYIKRCPDASVVHAPGIGQLQEYPPVAGSRLSTWKSIQRAVTTMGLSDLVVGDDYLVRRVASGMMGR